MRLTGEDQAPHRRHPWSIEQPLVGAFFVPSLLRSWDESSARELLDTLAAAGVTAICTEAAEYRNEVIDWVHAAGMSFIGGISCFSEHETGNAIVAERSELWPILETGERREPSEGYVGVVPTVAWYRDERIRLAEQVVRDHAMDALFLDFVRWPLHWELELRPEAGRPLQSSFDKQTLALFQEATGVEVPVASSDPSEAATWIVTNAAEAWTDFRCSVITEFVTDITAAIRSIRADLIIGAYVVPLPASDLAVTVGQQLPALAGLVDIVAPMLYHGMVHRPPEWVGEMGREFVRACPSGTVATLQVDSAEGPEFGADWGPPMSSAEWESVIVQALESGVVGLIGWTGTAMLAPDRRRTLVRALGMRT